LLLPSADGSQRVSILQAIYVQLIRKCVCRKSSISGILWWSYANIR